MKKWILFFVAALVMCAALLSCGPKPAYKTHEGKKKLEHYNKLQFGQKI